MLCCAVLCCAVPGVVALHNYNRGFMFCTSKADCVFLCHAACVSHWQAATNTSMCSRKTGVILWERYTRHDVSSTSTLPKKTTGTNKNRGDLQGIEHGRTSFRGRWAIADAAGS